MFGCVNHETSLPSLYATMAVPKAELVATIAMVQSWARSLLLDGMGKAIHPTGRAGSPGFRSPSTTPLSGLETKAMAPPAPVGRPSFQAVIEGFCHQRRQAIRK